MTDAGDAAAERRPTDEALSARNDGALSARPDDVGRRANTISTIALVVSVITLLITGYVSLIQLRVQKDALEAQEQQIEDLNRQFHGEVAINLAYVNAWNPTTKRWSLSREGRDFDNQRLRYEQFSGQLYVIMLAANVGESPAALQDAGILVGEGQIEGRTVRCALEGEGDLSACSFPREVPSQKVLAIQVQVNDISDLLTCNDFVEASGLTGAVQLLDGSIVSHPTTTSVPFSNDCDQGEAPPD
jgi:hypothetical protein